MEELAFRPAPSSDCNQGFSPGKYGADVSESPWAASKDGKSASVFYNCFTFLFILFAKRVDVLGGGANVAAGGFVTTAGLKVSSEWF